MKRLGRLVTACASLFLGVSPATAKQGSFRLQEATVASIHDAFASGQLTCTQLTKLHLDRIDAYDRRGPSLRAIITVNPRAMETAAEMDRQYAANRSGAVPLHCIPIILKDNFNIFDMPTTGGNISMKSSIPPAAAFPFHRMRPAPALLLPHQNLQQL